MIFVTSRLSFFLKISGWTDYSISCSMLQTAFQEGEGSSWRKCPHDALWRGPPVFCHAALHECLFLLPDWPGLRSNRDVRCWHNHRRCGNCRHGDVLPLRAACQDACYLTCRHCCLSASQMFSNSLTMPQLQYLRSRNTFHYSQDGDVLCPPFVHIQLYSFTMVIINWSDVEGTRVNLS